MNDAMKVVEGTITGTGRFAGRDVVYIRRLDGVRLRGSLPKNLKGTAATGDVVKFRVEVLADHQDGEWLWPSSGEVFSA